MPKKFKYHGSSLLEISTTGGHLVVGIIILLAAFSLLAVAIPQFQKTSEEFGAEGEKIFIAIGLLIFIIAMYIGFWSSHVYIDKGRQSIFFKSGLFGLGQTQKYPLSDFTHIKRRFIEGDSDSNDEYPIQLINENNLNTTPYICKHHDLQASQAQLDALQDFLQLPIADMTLGPVSHVVKADQKLSRERNDRSDDIIIEYTAADFLISSLVSTSMPFMFILFLCWDIFLKNLFYMLEFFLVWALVLLLIAYKFKRSPPKIKITINDKEFRMSFSGRRKAIVIKLTDIHSVSLYAPGGDARNNWSNKIIIQTNTIRHEIAKGLSAAEITSIYELLKTRL